MVEAVSATILHQPMFNLSVDTAHTFFVGEGQWLVHNDVCYVKVDYEDESNELVRRARQFRLDHKLDGRPITTSSNTVEQTLGDVAVFEVKYPNGTIDYIPNRNSLSKHAEIRISEQIPAEAEVQRIYTELHPCPNCQMFIENKYQDVEVIYSFPYPDTGWELAKAVDKLFGYAD